MKILNFIIYILVFFKITFISATDYYPYEINLIDLHASKTDNINIGSAERGKKIFISRRLNCLSCHEAPIPDEKFHGNFGPSLYGIGSRYNKSELRIRIIDSKIINPDSIMPTYYKKLNYPRIPKKYLNKTILNVQEVEDLVEYLYSLK